MARILRGDVVWAELDPTKGNEQAGRRPVLVLSQDVFNERSGTVIAVAITSNEPKAHFPLTLELTHTKMPKRSWVKISQVRTLLRITELATLGGTSCAMVVGASLGQAHWPGVIRRDCASDRGAQRNCRSITLRAPEPRGDTVIVFVALDNLVKGAAGQAVQNMNLTFGIEEREGLVLPCSNP